MARQRERQRQQVEGRLLAEHLERFHDRQAEGFGQLAHDLARLLAGQCLQLVDQRALRLAALCARARQQRGIKLRKLSKRCGHVLG
jgi:hypothetical protein